MGCKIITPIFPVFVYGILPAGWYRLVKEFDLSEPDLPEGAVMLAREFAVAEFTVEETLDWEDFYRRGGNEPD